MKAPWQRHAGNVVIGGLLLAIIAMLIVPLPTSMLNVLLVSNMAIAVALLMTALFAPQPRQMTIFPTILVFTTLLRVGLSVATTRLILSQADAGTVVSAFGQSAAGGSVIIGLVIFSVITVVQLLVVTKGAERVAEVSARFALDAMPGKQLAIDADVRSGAIDSIAARQQRDQLEQDSQLMGAMDGAMRFIKGDAIAAIVIVLINLVGGLAVGMAVNNMSASDALQTYSVLSIGEGLLAQIPSLMSAIASALLITRMATMQRGSGGVASDIVTQVFGQPLVLLVTATFLMLLALLPAMPLLPFLCLALVVAGSAWWLQQQRRRQEVCWHRDQDVNSPNATCRFELRIAANSTTMRMPGPQQRQALSDIAGIVKLRTGCTVHSMRLCYLANDATANPGLNSLDQLWVDGTLLAYLPKAISSTQLVAAASDLLVQHVAEWLSVDDVMHMLQSSRTFHNSLVTQVVPDLCSPIALTQLVRRLYQEQLYPKDLSMVLSAIAVVNKQSGANALGFDVDHLAERTRQSLRRQITNQLAPAGTMSVYTVDPMIEDAVRAAVDMHNGVATLAMEPDIAMDIIAAVRVVSTSTPTIVMTSADIRRHLRGLIEGELPNVVVLAPHEVLPGTNIQSVGQIGIP